jgi:hypothetical protein
MYEIMYEYAALSGNNIAIEQMWQFTNSFRKNFTEKGKEKKSSKGFRGSWFALFQILRSSHNFSIIKNHITAHNRQYKT